MSSIRLHNSRPRPGSRHRVKRLGCGESSGHGKTSGKGHKGQKARSGGSIRLGFEGGQMPLIRRIPKRGFNNTAFKTVYAPVNLTDIERLFEEPGSIDEQGLRAKGLVKGTWDGVKILGTGEVKKKFSLKVNAISASAGKSSRRPAARSSSCPARFAAAQQRQGKGQRQVEREGRNREARAEGQGIALPPLTVCTLGPARFVSSWPCWPW